MIIIFEPQCIGFEHSKFNSLFIEIISKAFNNEILFLAEKEHLKNVEALIPNKERICFKETNVPPKYRSNMRRFCQEFKLTKEVFKLAESLNCHKIIFSSIKSPSLIAAKFFMHKFPEIEVMIVPHSIIDSVTNIPLSRDFIFWFRIWFQFFNKKKLKYLVLGKTIKDEVLKEFPSLEGHVEYIDHPVAFKNFEIHNLNDGKVSFGFLGTCYRKKGINEFIKILNEVQKNYGDNCNFLVAGHVPEGEHIQLKENNLNISSKPLNEKDYEKKIEKIDYATFLHKSDDYRFTASGVFFDAISYLKPVIAIRNPFFEYYFNLMGDIGYLCDNYNEVKEVIAGIIESHDNKKYIQQQLNMKMGREKISIERLAGKMQLLW